MAYVIPLAEACGLLVAFITGYLTCRHLNRISDDTAIASDAALLL